MILYLETSNLVKLYVAEVGSGEIKKAVEESEAVATSIISYVEGRAAFARKSREKSLSARRLQIIKADFERDWDGIFVINLTDRLVRMAAGLSEKHGLRGYDAVHLASALELKEAVEASVLFSSADDQLYDAARIEGLG